MTRTIRAAQAVLLALTLVNPAATFAQAVQTAPNPDAEIQTKIRSEELSNSQILRTLHFFTDVYGPRLTGSPNHKAAADWAVKQMTAWGFDNAHLEPWEFGHPGWSNEMITAHVILPYKESLVCEVLAWTPSTPGVVRAQAVQLILPEKPTQETLKAYFDSMREKVKGKIALVGKHAYTPVVIDPPAKRIADESLKAQISGGNPAGPDRPARPGGSDGSPSRPANAGPRSQLDQSQPTVPGQLRPAQIVEQLDDFLLSSGVRVRANDSTMEQRRIRAFHNRTYDPSKVVPTVVMSNEDYGRMTRVMADGAPVELEFNIVNQTYPEGRTSYNVIGELAGTDKKDEVIMLGGHLDSWHSATGATDNAIGCATMMEAARILKAIGVRPRRTIRVALWSGEEQGLLGSQAYVKEHFGSAENPKPEFYKFGGYFNIDAGTGRARGFSIFGPSEAADALKGPLAGFEDLGFFGVGPSKSRALGGSDNGSFNQAGLPGIGARQDPIEYFTVTWHTNLDTYERIIEDDVKKSAIVIASAVYNLAMRDELLPRFTKETMPELPPARP